MHTYTYTYTYAHTYTRTHTHIHTHTHTHTYTHTRTRHKCEGMMGILKEDYPLVPIVALTATARTKVAEDTISILKINQCTRFSLG